MPDLQNLPDGDLATARQAGGKSLANRDLVLYDGVCGLCNRFIKVVLDGDKAGRFCFASLQSELARGILRKAGRDAVALNTIYLVKNYRSENPVLLTKARAAMAIMKCLNSPVRLIAAFGFMPTAVLDFGYDTVAANRYRVFGKLDACPLPNPDHVSRFLDHST
jgi:predicted DCC family thiol-disulfide oxidoreductase YuxK